jgi:hypothetical protein
LLLTGIPALVAVIAVSLNAPVFLSLVPLSVLLVVSAIGTLQVAEDEISYFDLLPPRRAMVFSTIAIGTAVIFVVKTFMWLLLVTIKMIRAIGDRNR